MTNAIAADPAATSVLFLTHSFPRHAGDAAGSFILRLATALREQGITVRVLAPHAAGLPVRDSIAGVEIERFRYAAPSLETLAYTGTMAEQVRTSWRARSALASLLAAGLWHSARASRRWRPDVVHAHWWFPGGLVAAALARTTGVPLVTTMHGSDVRLARAIPASHAPFRWVLRSSFTATAVSSWLANQAHEIAPSLPRPVVAPMPAATQLFTPGDGDARDTKRLLFVGRLNAQKGIEVLLRALALTRQTPALDVIGDGEDAPKLRSLAQSLGIAERVAWHAALPQERLAGFYRRAAALIMPSRDEGLGLVAVEGQLCETPVIAFDSGGLRDIVRDGETGVLVSEPSPAALAAAIDNTLAHYERALELGRAGRRSALAAFAPETAARRYAVLYAEAVASRRTLRHVATG